MICLYPSLETPFHPCCSGKILPVLAGLMLASQVLRTLTGTSAQHLGERRFLLDVRVMIPGEMSAAQNVLKLHGFGVACGIFLSGSERGRQRSQAEAPPRCWQRVSHAAPPFAPLHGAFPALPLTLPLAGCVASCGKERPQLGGNPLSCQVCFQRAQKGTFLFIRT